MAFQTAAFQPSDLEQINEAIASGALRVRFADREVTYRSIDDLLKAKALIESDLAQPNRRILTYYKSGF